MTQSVTSYIYHPDTGPGVLCWVVLGELIFGHRGEHTLVYRQCGTLQVAAPAVRDLQQSERAPLHSIPCTALETAQPCPEVWSARWCALPAYRVQRTCNKCISRTSVNMCSCCSWTGTSNTQVSWRTLGRCPSFHGGPLGEFGRSKNTQREGFYVPWHSEVGVEDSGKVKIN